MGCFETKASISSSYDDNLAGQAGACWSGGDGWLAHGERNGGSIGIMR